MKIPEENTITKSVLLDTSILIEISKGREGLRPFLLALKEAAMDPFIIDAVYFELIGHSDTVRDQMRLQEFVQTTYPVLPSPQRRC